MINPETVKRAVLVGTAALVVTSLAIVLTHIARGFDPWGQNIVVTGAFILLLDQLLERAQRVRAADIAAARLSLIVPVLQRDLRGFLELIADREHLAATPSASQSLRIDQVFIPNDKVPFTPANWTDNDMRLLLENAARTSHACSEAMTLFRDDLPPTFAAALYTAHHATTRGLAVTRGNFEHANKHQTPIRKDGPVASEVAAAALATAEIARGLEVVSDEPFFSAKAYNLPNLPASVVAGIVAGNYPPPRRRLTRQQLKRLERWRPASAS